MVGIAHGQKSIHRAILIPVNRVYNRIPKETSVARVNEKWETSGANTGPKNQQLTGWLHQNQEK